METAVTSSTLRSKVAGGARRQGTSQLCRSQTGRVRGSLTMAVHVCLFVNYGHP